jgi:hypothetical protein
VTGVQTCALPISQVSLFDVSDPARPRRIDQEGLGAGSSQVEYDHHAFTWWAPRRLAVLPVQTYDGVPHSGAVGITVKPDGLERLGRVTHTGVTRPPADGQGVEPGAPAPAPDQPRPGSDKFTGGSDAPILRSLVIGDALYTVSEQGVLSSSLDDLTPRQWVRF